jgi:hypothetical protein
LDDPLDFYGKKEEGLLKADCKNFINLSGLTK